jgi:hypothetical protein
MINSSVVPMDGKYRNISIFQGGKPIGRDMRHYFRWQTMSVKFSRRQSAIVS